MKKQIVVQAILFILFCGAASSSGQQAVPEEAKRYFDRGMAAVETAKSPDDFASAIKEFEQAASLAPDWLDVYYNPGIVQEKAEKYSDAKRNLKQYLRRPSRPHVRSKPGRVRRMLSNRRNGGIFECICSPGNRRHSGV
ncbi:MAG: hypothetical protein ABSC62_02935 [Terracidiphilus sp.]|jgi:tetratricopeptide (TPR) repeat protein